MINDLESKCKELETRVKELEAGRANMEEAMLRMGRQVESIDCRVHHLEGNQKVVSDALLQLSVATRDFIQIYRERLEAGLK